MKKTGENRFCETCGREFYAPGWTIKRGFGKFCNFMCNINLFKAGEPSKNKGVKNPGWTNSGSFKKGENIGENHPSWNGGRVMLETGYVLLFKPEHPHAKYNENYIQEHRWVMEQSLGRYLEPDERVHHINFNKADNRIENLMLFSSESEHQKYHWKIKRGEIIKK
jgi:hypothetical protein